MAQRRKEGDMEHGAARTKVAGDDEMLRTGYHHGTPLEAGKIADSQPVDLFAPATRLAGAAPAQQQQQQMRRPEQEEEDDDEGTKEHVIAESEPVDLLAGARGVAEANQRGGAAASAAQGQGRQGMAEPTAGGRRLGRQ
ncbi:hypothetical protein ACP70R_002745 [Stipagrostis hirtigluma subsp. patula]